MAFAALSVSAGLARSPFVLSDAVPAECMSMEKVDMPMMNRETTVEQLKEMIHAHPTLSEILQECAREF